MKYTVIKIQEADYGCEERPAGYVPEVVIRLCDESGREREMEVPDADLYALDIEEGDSVYFDDDNKINKVYPDVRYRLIRKEDGYEWYTLLDTVWRSAYGNIFPEEVFDARDSHREERAAAFTEEKFIGERKTAYVAEKDGKIVGLMFATLDSDYEFFRNDYADLVALYVHPDYQGRGIGSGLRDLFIKWAKEKKADRYVIGVLKENTKARKVYESWGGKLSEHQHDFTVMNAGYPEVFYTYKI